MENIIRNTEFDNLVNYTTKTSSDDCFQNTHYNSEDPTSLAYYLKYNPIVEYHLMVVSEKDITDEVIEDSKIEI